MTRRTSLVAICSRSRDSSCSVSRCTSSLSWLSSVARGLFFFFEAPTLAMRVLLAPNLEDFQRLTVREADQKTPWPESLLDNEVECQPAAEILSFPAVDEKQRKSNLIRATTVETSNTLRVHPGEGRAARTVALQSGIGIN